MGGKLGTTASVAGQDDRFAGTKSGLVFEGEGADNAGANQATLGRLVSSVSVQSHASQPVDERLGSAGGPSASLLAHASSGPRGAALRQSVSSSTIGADTKQRQDVARLANYITKSLRLGLLQNPIAEAENKLLEVKSSNKAAVTDLEAFQCFEKMKKLYKLKLEREQQLLALTHADSRAQARTDVVSPPDHENQFYAEYRLSATRHRLRRDIRDLKEQTSDQSLYYANQVHAMKDFLWQLGYNFDEKQTCEKTLFALELLHSDEITLVEVLFDLVREYLPEREAEEQYRMYYEGLLEEGGDHDVHGWKYGAAGSPFNTSPNGGASSDEDSDAWTSDEESDFSLESASEDLSNEEADFSDASSDVDGYSANKNQNNQASARSSLLDSERTDSEKEDQHNTSKHSSQIRAKLKEMKRKGKRPPPLAEFLRWMQPDYTPNGAAATTTTSGNSTRKAQFYDNSSKVEQVHDHQPQSATSSFDFDPDARALAAKAVHLQDQAIERIAGRNNRGAEPSYGRSNDKNTHDRRDGTPPALKPQYSRALDHPEFANYLRQVRRIDPAEFCAFLSAFLGVSGTTTWVNQQMPPAQAGGGRSDATIAASSVGTGQGGGKNGTTAAKTPSVGEDPLQPANFKPLRLVPDATVVETQPNNGHLLQVLPEAYNTNPQVLQVQYQKSQSEDFLHQLKRRLLTKHEELLKLQEDCGCFINHEEWEKQCQPVGFANEAFNWASGKINFAQLCASSELQEGVLIRCLKSLEELLRKIKTIACDLKMVSLELLALDAIQMVKRDVVFLPSLYYENIDLTARGESGRDEE
ncbi:unnamed protein product [Amoebophrya sp. A120]|nr:unnamed protein product [Amoebophrya sp. A120]|eukprot:GSA120T00009669001.1